MSAAATTDFVFEPRTDKPVECLTSAGDGLWACSDEQTGFVVGMSADDGASFGAKLHFYNILGPLECAPGSGTSERCPPTGPVGCVREEPSEGAGRTDASALPPSRTPARGCGCEVGMVGGPVLGAAAMALVVAASVLRRRRG